MARIKTRATGEIRKLIDLDDNTIKTIAKDAIDRDLGGFKVNAERILREAAAKIKAKKYNHVTTIQQLARADSSVLK